MQAHNLYETIDFPPFPYEDKKARMNQIKSLYPNLENNLKSWQIKCLDNPFLLPYQLHHDLIKTLKKISDIYFGYIDGRIGNYKLEPLSGLLEKVADLFVEVEKFNTENKHEKFICDLELKKWLESQYNSGPLLKKIQEDNSLITNDTLPYIHAPIFFQRHKKELLLSIENKRLSFVELDKKTLLFHIQYNTAYSFGLQCQLEKFMSAVYIDQSEINVDMHKLKQHLSFINTLEQKRSLLEFMNYILKDTDYSINFYFQGKKGSLSYFKGDDLYTKIDYKYLQDSLLSDLLEEDLFSIRKKWIAKIDSVQHWKKKD